MIRKLTTTDLLESCILKKEKLTANQKEGVDEYFKELEIAYNEGNPLISDDEFEELRDLYIKYNRTVAEDNSYENKLEDTGDVKGDTIKHTEPVLSLEKIKTEEELDKFLEKLTPCMAEVKYDGLTLVFYPGKSDYKVATRKDGVQGEDVTDVIKASGIINEKDILSVGKPFRGEAYLTKSNLKLVNEQRVAEGKDPFENTRNGVAGIFNSKDNKNAKYISFVAYDVFDDELSLIDKIKLLKKSKIPTSAKGHYKVATNADLNGLLKAWILQFNDNEREKLDFDIDGIVIKTIVPNALKKFGSTGHHPKHSVAYKFKSLGAWSYVKRVEWSTGKTGRITPVGVLDPVKVLGATIRSVTLNNINFIEKLGIELGKPAYIIKSNDVIPCLEYTKSDGGTYQKIEAPTECPSCGGSVTRIENLHYCENAYCRARLDGTILHYAKRDALNIEGLAESTVSKIIETGKITYPIDIFKLTLEDIKGLEGFADKSAKKLYDAIQNSRENVALNKFLYTACIPLLGRTASKLITNKFLTLGKFVADIKKGCPETILIKDIGEGTVENIIKYQNMIGMLYTVIKPVNATPIVVNKEAKTFCFTGKLGKARTEYKKIVEEAGHIFKDKITKDVNYLVLGANVGQTKIDKATSYGIESITEDVFFSLL